MKNNPTFLKSILVGASALGLALTLHANEAESASSLLGQHYVATSVGIVDLDAANTPRVFHVDYNRNFATGVDLRLELDYFRSQPTNSVLYGHARYADYNAAVAVRTFTVRGRFAPYAEAGAGWTWFKLAGWREDSFVWFAGAGVEASVTRDLSLTPFVRYTDRVNLFRGDQWSYGVRANYALTPRVGLVASVERDDDRNTRYTAGLSYRF